MKNEKIVELQKELKSEAAVETRKEKAIVEFGYIQDVIKCITDYEGERWRKMKEQALDAVATLFLLENQGRNGTFRTKVQI